MNVKKKKKSKNIQESVSDAEAKCVMPGEKRHLIKILIETGNRNTQLKIQNYVWNCDIASISWELNSGFFQSQDKMLRNLDTTCNF